MRWTPTPFITASFVAHGAALAGGVVAPQLWPWWLGLVAGNQVLLTGAGLLPRSRWLGPNHTRLPLAAQQAGHVALTFDDGPDPQVTPQVLDLLDRYQAKASFFCIGSAVSQYPGLLRDIVARGHSIENHGHAHSPFFAFWGSRRMQGDLLRLQQAVHAATGTWPLYFRPTAGFRNPLLDRVLARLGLRLVMWTRRGFDTRCRDAQTVRRCLERGLAAGDILLLHDGHAARTAQGEPMVLAVLPALLQTLHQRRLQPVTLRQGLQPQLPQPADTRVLPAESLAP